MTVLFTLFDLEIVQGGERLHAQKVGRKIKTHTALTRNVISSFRKKKEKYILQFFPAGWRNFLSMNARASCHPTRKKWFSLLTLVCDGRLCLCELTAGLNRKRKTCLSYCLDRLVGCFLGARWRSPLGAAPRRSQHKALVTNSRVHIFFGSSRKLIRCWKTTKIHRLFSKNERKKVQNTNK